MRSFVVAAKGLDEGAIAQRHADVVQASSSAARRSGSTLKVSTSPDGVVTVQACRSTS